MNETQDVLAQKKSSGRKPIYNRDLLLPHIQFLWSQMERISGKRMKGAYPDWLLHHETEDFTTAVRLQLEKMSPATLERMLRMIRSNQAATQGLSSTCPAR